MCCLRAGEKSWHEFDSRDVCLYKYNTCRYASAYQQTRAAARVAVLDELLDKLILAVYSRGSGITFSNFIINHRFGTRGWDALVHRCVRHVLYTTAAFFARSFLSEGGKLIQSGRSIDRILSIESRFIISSLFFFIYATRFVEVCGNEVLWLYTERSFCVFLVNIVSSDEIDTV